ncbi:LOW QUALITY PROTEIN: hypothetical protein TorRG33x02_337630 [Trema orientale]|uniref:Uncharacterized protein n=1 Tax=Trema orientale TaxID=63057 RepID=A0A2P5AYR7_TREOI|nr:LOW QUALITY PROTEIN: hypothetical protein TorRG33x02_337630 [Trema orientale]
MTDFAHKFLLTLHMVQVHICLAYFSWLLWWREAYSNWYVAFYCFGISSFVPTPWCYKKLTRHSHSWCITRRFSTPANELHLWSKSRCAEYYSEVKEHTIGVTYDLLRIIF